MNLNTENWKSFYLRELFSIQMGNGFDKNKMNDDNPQINFVSRVSYNNGVDIKVDYIDGIVPFEAGLVTVALGGSYLGSCFVQEEPFYTAQNVAVMKSKFPEMSKQVNLFISGLVRFESKVKYYAFGRELNSHINKDFDIKLPVIIDKYNVPIIDQTHKYSENGYIPDWQFIENYIKSLHYKPLTTKNKVGNIGSLEINNWKSFKVGRILSILNGKGITNDEIEENPGTFNAVQSGEENNGVLGKIDLIYCKKKKYTVSERSCLTVARSGSAGYVSFHPNGCVVGDSAKILLLPEKIASNGVYLFIQTLLTANRFKYAYGRKVTEEKYAEDEIKLPILSAADGTPVIDNSNEFSDEGYVPDWQFMEDYIKSLPYGDRI